MASDGSQVEFIRIPLKALDACHDHAAELLTYSILVRNSRFKVGKSVCSLPSSTLMRKRKISQRTFWYHIKWLVDQGLVWRVKGKFVMPCGLHIQMPFSIVDSFMEKGGCSNAWMVLCYYTKNTAVEYPQRMAADDTGLSLATIKRCMKWLQESEFLIRVRMKVCKVLAAIPRESESKRLLRRFNDLRRSRMLAPVPVLKEPAFRKRMKSVLKVLSYHDVLEHLEVFSESKFFKSYNAWSLFCSSDQWHWLGKVA